MPDIFLTNTFTRKKEKFEPTIKSLVELGFQLYATEHTHEFLTGIGIDSILLHKVSEKKNPNLEDLLRQNRFDVIIHRPHQNPGKKEIKDIEMIAQWAVKTDTLLIDDLKVAENFVKKLQHRMVRQNHE